MTLAHDFPAVPTTRTRRRPRVPAPAWRRLLSAARPLVEHRLFQFAVLGGLIFAVAPRTRSPESIEVTSERLAALRAAEVSRAAGKTPPEELGREVDQRAIEDEILYREGVRLGLDRNDGIVRQRVVQKVLFLAEEAAGATQPAGEAELAAFFEKNRVRWAVGEVTRFSHVYRHRPEALAAWATGDPSTMGDTPKPPAGEPPAGEPSPLPAELDADRSRIAASFGAGFAEAIAGAPVGKWSGPYPSAFGWHLVRVAERRPARPAELAEVRGAVVEAFGVYRKQEAIAAFLQGAQGRYRVAIDGKPIERFTPSRRVAFRSVTSGED